MGYAISIYFDMILKGRASGGLLVSNIFLCIMTLMYSRHRQNSDLIWCNPLVYKSKFGQRSVTKDHLGAYINGVEGVYPVAGAFYLIFKIFEGKFTVECRHHMLT